MAVSQMSRGELPLVFAQTNPNPEPVFQFLDIEALAENRIKLTLNDGLYKSRFVIMASQLRSRVESGEISNYSIAILKRFAPQPLNNNTRKVLVVFELELLESGENIGKEIGTPRPLDDKGLPVPGNAVPPPQQNQQAQAANRQVPNNNSNTAAGRQLPTNEMGQATPPKRANFGNNSANNQTRPVKQDIATGNMYGNSNNNYSGAGGSVARGGAASNDGGMGGGGDYNSISSLNPYQHKWTIKARVTAKNFRSYQKKQGTGEGQMLKLVLTDQSGEISATAWNEEAQRFNDMIDNQMVYTIQGGRINQVKTQFMGPVKNDYEIMFGKETVITPEADADDMPTTSYNFVKISELANERVDGFVDIIGVIRVVGAPATINSKTTGKVIPKRDVEIMDDSNTSVNCTLWDAHSVTVDDLALNQVLVIKGAKVSEWNTRSLNVGGTASIAINPQLNEAFALKGWLENDGKNTVPQCLSMRGADYGAGAGGSGSQMLKTFEQAQAEGLGTRETTDFFNNLCYITNLNKDKLGYEACTSEGCMKKVIPNGAGMYRCEKCNREMDTPKFRLLTQMYVADHCSGVWTSCFGDQTEQLLGKTSAEVGEMLTNPEGGSINELVKSVLYTSHVFRFRAKQETYNDEARVKYSIQSIVPMTPKQEADALTQLLKAAGVPGTV